MATWQRTITMDTRTKEGVTEWIETVHEAMTSVGCVQTGDTGQLDIDSYPDPVFDTAQGVPIEYGYRIYELNDDRSHAEPIYIKLQFIGNRYGNAGVLIGETYVTVGFSTNGAGSMTGATAAAMSPHSNYTQTQNQTIKPDAPCFACRIDGFLFVVVGCGYNYHTYGGSHNTATFFAISRKGSSATLYHSNGSSLMQSSAYSALSVTVVDRELMASTGPTTPTLLVPAIPSTGGSAIVLPAIVYGLNGAWEDLNVVSVPASMVEDAGVYLFSSDDYTDIQYLILPFARSMGNAQTMHKLDVVANTGARYTQCIGMRWEL